MRAIATSPRPGRRLAGWGRIALLLSLAAPACDKKEREPESVPPATKQVDESQAATAVLALPETAALVAAEAAFQATVESGPAAAFVDKARALEAAGKALAAKIPDQAYETPLPDKLHQSLGMIGAISEQLAQDPVVRKRLASAVHRNLAAVFELRPLPYEPVTTVEMSMARFCTVLGAGLVQATGECGSKATLPACCAGAGCDEPLVLDLEKIEVCNEKVVSAGCAGKLEALPPECARDALVK